MDREEWRKSGQGRVLEEECTVKSGGRVDREYWRKLTGNRGGSGQGIMEEVDRE